MMLEIKGRDPISNLALEVLDDPLKKEMVLYLMCYLQMVKREGGLYVELEKFLNCAYKNFRNARNHWKDVLVELNLLNVIDLYGNVYSGKDMYRLESGELYLIGLRSEYQNLFEPMAKRIVKLWNVLNKTYHYRKPNTLQDAVTLSTLLFNEGLFEETKAYAEICAERYTLNRSYFDMLNHLSQIYCVENYKGQVQDLKEDLQALQKLGKVYCGVNLIKLRADLEEQIRRLERGKPPTPLRIEFVNNKIKRESLVRRLFKGFKSLIRIFRGKEEKGESYFEEGGLCLRSSQTPYISS
ncbi:MAG: hypothetical protein D6674_04750 [Acidobacteria bacterium]|nr:MAG: hypothetical protein D6674_04750 [Acidobacteriota bacterium]